MEENGDKANQTIVKTHEEKNIDYLMRDIVDRREESRAIVEEVPVKSEGSNSIIERAVHSLIEYDLDKNQFDFKYGCSHDFVWGVRYDYECAS